MKADDPQFLELLQISPQFRIPIYQRIYSWTEKECGRLWDDIVRAGTKDKIKEHFVGSIVSIEEGLSLPTQRSPLQVIDGQQRLTTVTLLLAALAGALDQQGGIEYEPVPGFSPSKLRYYYLLNEKEKGERRYKLLLSPTDRNSLIAIVECGEQPNESSRVSDNFQFFKGKIAECNGEFAALCNGLMKLRVVTIALQRGHDNPQLIFESMNSTGLDLTQADLIRNYILMDLEHERQTRLYKQAWQPMELDFRGAYGKEFDGFMRHYLTMKTREIPNVRQVYEAFKLHAQPRITQDGVEALVQEIQNFARYFCRMALGAEPDPALKLAFDDLRELKVDVAYPFLLELYHDYATGTLLPSDFLTAVRLVESYVFRRAVCMWPPNSLNRTFANFAKAIKKDRYLESIQAHFLGLQSYRVFPQNDEFWSKIQTRDLYNFRSKLYWLRRLENHGRSKERVPVGEYTIEHILPQNENLSANWREALGPEWKRIQKEWLHTLGNLTLTGYNSEYNDRSFTEKRDLKENGEPIGFKHSPLKLNAGLGQLEKWDEDAIKARAEGLAKVALEVWIAPKLSDKVLKAYQPEPAPSKCSIADHPRLQKEPLRPVFEAFRKEVVALDPCVTEEFLRICVAYKAESNFVDVEPQAKRLLLTLNMTFTEIIDPKGLCRDVTGKGHQGNGDVQIGLASLEELPYVMALVRQSFEAQMNSGSDA